jgi:hypothetical protein
MNDGLDYFFWLFSKVVHDLMWRWPITTSLALATCISWLWAGRRTHPFPCGVALLQCGTLGFFAGMLALGTRWALTGCVNDRAILFIHLLLACQAVAAVALVWAARRIRVFAGCAQAFLLWCSLWAWIAAREPGPFL